MILIVTSCQTTPRSFSRIAIFTEETSSSDLLPTGSKLGSPLLLTGIRPAGIRAIGSIARRCGPIQVGTQTGLITTSLACWINLRIATTGDTSSCRGECSVIYSACITVACVMYILWLHSRVNECRVESRVSDARRIGACADSA
jgi:hypothetical protein